MILHIPHSSRKIPAEVRNQFLLTDAELKRELLAMTDAYTDELFSADLAPGDTTVIFPVSRLVVDPERFADDAAEPMAKRGMAAVYVKTHDGRSLRRVLAPDEKQALLDTYYSPHHQRLSEAVYFELATTGASLLLDCHSFPSTALPYELDQSPTRPQICIGANNFHTPSDVAELLVQHFKSAGLTVELNRPFAGAIVPMKYYHQDARVISVMLEINRSLYMEENTGGKTDKFKEVQTLITKAAQSLRKYQIEKEAENWRKKPIIPAPECLKKRMEAVRAQPPVSLEQVLQQARASAKHRRQCPEGETVCENDIIKVWIFVSGGCRADSAHGPAHWQRVERIGLKLSARTGADKTVVRLFALFHDAGRMNDMVDDGHGLRGAEIAKCYRGEMSGLTDEQFTLLYDACVGHTDGKRSDDPTIGTCWDADRLDLERVGILPDEEFMSTAFGKEIARTGNVYPVLLDTERQEGSQ